jgi:hypothetical protein
MLRAQGETMDTAGLEERLAKLAPSFQRASPLIVGVFTVVTILLASNLYLSPPTFQTDLNEFSPETEASLAHDRIHEHFPTEMRPLFVHVTADDGSNVLALEALKTMSDDLAHFQNESEKRQAFVTVWTTAPGILQLALDEEADGRSLASLNDWPEVLSLVFDDNETCGLTADDQRLCFTKTWTTTLFVTIWTTAAVPVFRQPPRPCGCWRWTLTSKTRFVERFNINFAGFLTNVRRPPPCNTRSFPTICWRTISTRGRLTTS